MQKGRDLGSWNEMRADTGLWNRLRNAASRLLILDYDGTLSPFVPDPSQAVPYPGVLALLDEIMALDCRVAMVTGRSALDLSSFLNLSRRPEIWGSHGGERLHPSGRHEPAVLDSGQREVLARARTWAASQGREGCLEDKPGCLAFHFRALDSHDRAEVEPLVRRAWAGLAGDADIILADFDGGLELRVAGFHKGRAVAAMLGESKAPVSAFYLGDDATDEDAFAALGDKGEAVLVRTRARATQARWWLRPPHELLEFLSAWRDACQR